MDELGRRVKERKLYWEPGRLTAHSRKHAEEFGLEKSDHSGYQEKLYKVLEKSGKPLMNLYKNRIQFTFQYDGYAVVVREGFMFKTGFRDVRNFTDSQLIPNGILLEER